MKTIRPEEVLATGACFRQRVNLPAAQVANLSEAELRAALSFEIEPFSGIPQAASRMAWKRVNAPDAARAVFDVVQIRTSDLAGEVAKARAAKRAVRAVTAPPEAALGETLEMLPWIPLKAARALPRSGLFVAALGGAVLLLALVWDFWHVAGERRALLRAVAEQRVLQHDKDGLLAKISAAQQAAANLRTARMETARAQQNAEVLRAAWRVLLEAVPKACRDESVLKSLSATGAYSAELAGLALSPDAATRTFVRLTDALKPPKSGWRLTPGAIQAPAAGGTVHFSCTLEFDAEGQFK